MTRIGISSILRRLILCCGIGTLMSKFYHITPLTGFSWSEIAQIIFVILLGIFNTRELKYQIISILLAVGTVISYYTSKDKTYLVFIVLLGMLFFIFGLPHRVTDINNGPDPLSPRILWVVEALSLIMLILSCIYGSNIYYNLN